MPLHVNLYHEVQRQDRARRRDPFRMAILAILIIMIGFVVNYFVVLEQVHIIGARYSAIQADWAKISPDAKAAKTRQDELNAEINASDAMMKRVDRRLYWAPVLDEIRKAVPRTVQVTHLGVEPPATEAATDAAIGMSGIAGAVEPRKEAEALRVAMVNRLTARFKHATGIFKNLDDSDQFVLLDGHRLATASFVIEFQVQVRDPVATPAPAAAAARRAKGGESE